MWELVGVVMTELRDKNSFGILPLVSNSVRKTLPLRISEGTDFGFRIGGAKSKLKKGATSEESTLSEIFRP